jgi:hypothetical protein
MGIMLREVEIPKGHASKASRISRIRNPFLCAKLCTPTNPASRAAIQPGRQKEFPSNFLAI